MTAMDRTDGGFAAFGFFPKTRPIASTKLMPSGAGHDAQDMARIGPAGMIFVPSVGDSVLKGPAGDTDPGTRCVGVRRRRQSERCGQMVFGFLDVEPGGGRGCRSRRT